MSNQFIKIHHFKTILNQLHPKMLFGFFVLEFKYQRKFRKLMKEMNWVDIKIKPRGYAANHSLLFYLLKILKDKKPRCILELGSGQTTKIFNKYLTENKDAKAIVLEENHDWFQFMKKNIHSHRLDYIYAPLKSDSLENINYKWYSYDFNDILQQKGKFDLIVIDGPKGTIRYSRFGLAKYITQIIDPSNFILIFDDSSRIGEEDTIKFIEKLFDNAQIKYNKFELFGSKKQTCLSSIDFNTHI